MGKTITRPPILEQLRSANPTQSYTIQGQKANHNTRVEEKLCQQWSPEQISGWLGRTGGPSLSHEWI